MARPRLPAHLKDRLNDTLPGGAPKLKRERKPRPAYWPPGVDSELEMALLTRLERAGLPLGVTQHPVVAGRQFRWDRCWPDRMVAAELQGGLWVNGAHSRGSGVERDCLKYSLGAAVGWRVLLISSAMLKDGTALSLIAQALIATTPPDSRAASGEE